MPCGLDIILLCIITHAWFQSVVLSSQGLSQGLLQSVPSSGECGNPILQYFMVSIGSSSGFYHRVSVSSGECGNAMLQYCYGRGYGFNRPQLWLIAQGLLQSVPSFQVSVAMPCYSIVML